MKLKQSFCYPIWEKAAASPADLFAWAKGVGFTATEFWSWNPEYDQVAAAAKQAGLAVSSFTGHESIDKGLNDPAEHERILGEIRSSIDRAAALEIPGIIVFSGARRAGQSDLAGLTACAQGLRQIMPYAEEKGVNLNMELLNSKVDHWDYQCDRTDWGIALCEMVGSPRFKLLFDIYHVQINEGDVIRNLLKALPYTGHIHTAGNPRRQELDDTQELNYRGICAALRDAGYEGYIGHEFFARNPDKLAALEQAFHVCDV